MEVGLWAGRWMYLVTRHPGNSDERKGKIWTLFLFGGNWKRVSKDRWDR